MCIRDRQGRDLGRQGCRVARGRRPYRPFRPPVRRTAAPRPERHRLSLRPVPERLRTEVRKAQQMASIWFLTGSQHLYGPKVLAQVADQSRTISDALAHSDAVIATIVAKPVLTDTDAIRRALIDANSDDDCIGVITWMHTFSPARMWITGLEQLRRPLLHLHAQMNRDLPWDTIDMDFMNLNPVSYT